MAHLGNWRSRERAALPDTLWSNRPPADEPGVTVTLIDLDSIRRNMGLVSGLRLACVISETLSGLDRKSGCLNLTTILESPPPAGAIFPGQ
jgi:hypothetical protein